MGRKAAKGKPGFSAPPPRPGSVHETEPVGQCDALRSVDHHDPFADPGVADRGHGDIERLRRCTDDGAGIGVGGEQ